MTRILCLVAAVLVLVPAFAASEAFSQAPPTVWHALGIPQTFKHFSDVTRNRSGNHPGLEKKPPLKKLADPANLKSDIPAVAKAAEIKAQEDLAPQKIKALKYLASVGCGCYGGIAEAFAAAMEDCTEEVRYEAALSIATAAGNRCEKCQKTCCTEELAEKMRERAYERDDQGCWIEPSERVREALKAALALCCPYSGPIGPDAVPVDPVIPVDPILPPDTDPNRPAVPVPNPPVPTPALPADGSETSAPGTFDAAATAGTPAQLTSSRRGWQSTRLPAAEGTVQTKGTAVSATISDFQPAMPQYTTVKRQVSGVVVDAKTASGKIRLAFHDNVKPRVGTVLTAYHTYLLGTEEVATLTIVDYEGSQAIAVVRGFNDSRVARGDEVHGEMLQAVSQ